MPEKSPHAERIERLRREVTAALQSRLDDPDLRSSVIAVLAKMRDCESTACLVRCLGDADRGTRMATLEALAPMKSQEIYAALQQVALSDLDPSLRDKAVVILESHRPATEHHLRELLEAGVVDAQGEIAADEIPLTMENDAL